MVTLLRLVFSRTMNLPSGLHSAMEMLPLAERWKEVRVAVSPFTTRIDSATTPTLTLPLSSCNSVPCISQLATTQLQMSNTIHSRTKCYGEQAGRMKARPSSVPRCS